jgi:hypothetical protein
MKMRKLLLLPAMVLLLTACGNGGGGGSSSSSQGGGGGGSSGGGSGGSGDYRPLTINFYLDYNHYDEENPYHSARWYYDTTFTKDDVGLVDPTEVPDQYYPTFKGWSTHALVDEDQYLWNFGTDKVAEADAVNGVIEFFGIFIGD